MTSYFLVLDASWFHNELSPALARSWRQASLAPVFALRDRMLPAMKDYADRFHTKLEESLLFRLFPNQPFERNHWRGLVGEAFLFGASEIPEVPNFFETLDRLLMQDPGGDGAKVRESYVPIQQAQFGSRDLVFGGGYYRPEHSGYNDCADVARLADYLDSLDPLTWTTVSLRPVAELDTEEDSLDELEFVREEFPILRGLYAGARKQEQIVICESL